MGGGGDHVSVGHRVLMLPAGHQTGDVGHVYHQIGPIAMGNLAQLGKVDGPRIG